MQTISSQLVDYMIIFSDLQVTNMGCVFYAINTHKSQVHWSISCI